MNRIFEDNMRALEARLPLVADQIRNADLPVTRQAVANHRRVVVYQYQYNGRWNNLNSAYDPIAEADAQSKGLGIEDAKLVFVLGEAGLYHLEAVLERAQSDAKVLMISQDARHLRLVMESRDVRGVLTDGRLTIIVSADMDLLKVAVQTAVLSDLYDVPTFALAVHPVEAQFQSDFFSTFESLLHWAFSTSLVNVNTTNFFEHWWSHNFVCNIPHLLTGLSLNELTDTWRSKPVVIVGAGPSLNKNIHLLKEFIGKSLVLCVDTAYRILQKHGIKPDLIVTLDGSPMNAAHMDGCSYADIPVLMDVYSHKDIVESHKASKIVISSIGLHTGWWTKVLAEEPVPSPLETGGSVATAAFSFARLLGADPVILIGVDLSYPEGACYASGALHDQRTIQEVEDSRTLYPVEDIYGNQVYTTYDYLYYLKWFHLQSRRTDRTYINATEGGALKDGFLIKSLAECQVEYCAQQPVDEWKSLLTPHPVDDAMVHRVVNHMKRSKRELKAAIKYFSVLIEQLTEYINRLEQDGLQELEELMIGMEKARGKLNRLPFALSFLDSHSFKTIYTDLKITESIERERHIHTETEKVTLSARQSLNLILGLTEVARASTDMHDDGIRYAQTFFANQLEVKDDELSQCV